jgi:ribonuclease HI
MAKSILPSISRGGLSPLKSRWKLQLSFVDFLQWKISSNSLILSFDGASKGNLGVEGVGGVFYSQEGHLEFNFAWSIGHSSNNQDEAYALLQGLIMEKAHGVSIMTIVRDSKLIINHTRQNSSSKNIHL